MPRPSVEAQRREQILSAACQVIADVGLKSLRLTDVAELAGVSSATIHYYFDTKREVVNAAFELNYERSLERRRALLDSAGADPLQTLRSLLDSYLPVTEDSVRAWRVWAELWAEGVRDESLQEVNARVYGQWRDLVRELVDAGQRAGTIRDGDAHEYADTVVAMIDGLSIQHLMHSPEVSLDLMRSRVGGYLDAISA